MYLHIRVFHSVLHLLFLFFFFFNDTATTEIYTLSLHDALPISSPDATLSGMPETVMGVLSGRLTLRQARARGLEFCGDIDRKSTRLNSSHTVISYAVFCLKKKKK